MRNPLAEDLDHVLARTGGLWEELRGARVFMTGGTGFFGCWLLETLLWANDRLGLDASVVVLTRQPAAFAGKAAALASHPALTLQSGDVRTFDIDQGAFSHVIHAGTETAAPVTAADSLAVVDSIVGGTRRVLDLARRSGARRFLLTSTGAVYGRQPADITHLSEEYMGGPDTTNPARAGAEAKRAAEMLCAIYADRRLQPTIARCFAFVGPYLPLDAHLAVGNFIRDALRGGPIDVAGDGSPQRSYLYAGDLAVWLWTVLLRGQPMRPYNVGSETAISIGELARAVAGRFAPGAEIRFARTPDSATPVDRYVPSTARIRTELGVTTTVELDEALARTASWHRERGAMSHVAN